jgi:stress-induced morphogen
VTALHKHLEAQKKKRESTDGSDLLNSTRDHFWLVLATKKIPGKSKVTPHRM